MQKIIKFVKKIVQPGFYNIIQELELLLENNILKGEKASGILTLFCMHTSCALLISEGWDPTARKDLENYFNYLAPEHLPFIQHDLEGPDDSPAHMKSALLHQSLSLLVEDGKIIMGQWQGIFLAEFRKGAHERHILMKFQPD